MHCEENNSIQKTSLFAEVVLFLPLDKPFHYRIPQEFFEKIKRGIRVEVPFGSRKVLGCVTSIINESQVPDIRDILSLCDQEPVFSEEMFKLASWLKENYVCSPGEALSAIVPANLHAPKRKLKKSAEKEDTPVSSRKEIVLTPKQKTAVDSIISYVDNSKFGCFVLHGVTGSGKTEVYLEVIEEAMKRGKTAVYLLPEISLTPQFIKIVQDKFPGLVGVWHSRLTGSQRYKTWDAARRGKIKIMLGARSALFAPFQNLGVIIIDEEHEPTYKQDQKPTYHSREVAIARARLNGAVVILGSATPSLEAYYGTQRGEYSLLEIDERIDKRAMPLVKIVDCNALPVKSRIITRPLSEALTRVLARREQAIIFLNRRGFSPAVVCPRCGNVCQCKRCAVSLVYHKTTNDLRCHYCGAVQPWLQQCPSCGYRELSVFGVGTQKVEMELKRMFPQGRVFRLDRDTASHRDVYYKAYEQFRNENYDILLGTQMVAKGFDFPRVTLVGVIDADVALYLPDFRAAERTFQLITQVAGRSGRSDLGGEVIVQTRYPDHYAILASKTHNYKGFYEKELHYRMQMNYPPFTRFVNILVRASKEERAKDAITKITADLRKLKEKENLKYDILGPVPAAHSRIRRLFRWQVLLKGDSASVLNAARSIRNYYLPRGILLNVDVDPQDVI
jgi:primosomal protein N' (replication factor Y)